MKRNLYLYLYFLETCVLCVLYLTAGERFPYVTSMYANLLEQKKVFQRPSEWLGLGKSIGTLTI